MIKVNELKTKEEVDNWFCNYIGGDRDLNAIKFTIEKMLNVLEMIHNDPTGSQTLTRAYTLYYANLASVALEHFILYRDPVNFCESPIECLLYNAFIFLRDSNLVSIGVMFSQIKIGKYRVDFLAESDTIEHGDKIILVECDGKEYHSSTEQKAKDYERHLYLEKKGFTIMRFTGSEIYQNPFACVLKIDEKFKELKPNGYLWDEMGD